MKSKVENLSSLIDIQLPNFIVSDYPNFAAFLQKYYEYLELPGNPIDLIHNITKYHDVDTYQNNILKETTILTGILSDSATTIFVEDTSSFPEENGYVLIDDEVIFYKTKTNNSLEDCYRNVNSAVKLGDLYNELTFSDVNYSDVGEGKYHSSGRNVLNVTNLFLYALIKNFEAEYLGPFPENLLRNEIDKSLFIKNIKSFYASKGTEQSIKFIFNALVNQEDDTPTIYYPKDNTIKASGGEWVTKFSLYAKIISGDPTKIIGSRLSQNKEAFGIIDDIVNKNNGFYEIIFIDSSVVGEFKVSGKTVLKKLLSETETERITVESTVGFESGSILINDEIISISSKNVNQFVISSRGSNPDLHDVNTEVYEYLPAIAKEFDQQSDVKFVILGLVKSFDVEEANPYSAEGDPITESKNVFESKNVIVFDYNLNDYRWLLNNNYSAPVSLNANITNSVDTLISNVSALYQDKDYFYIASSGYPNYSFGKSNWNASPFVDNKLLKIIPKNITQSTTISETPLKDTGILVNGCLIYNYKDEETIEYGEIVDIQVTNKGQGYLNAPFVIIEDVINSSPAKAKAILSGEVVDKIIIDNSGEYRRSPNVIITSGRNAVVSAVVTLGRITSLKIDNPGEYYSSPPEIIIKDRNGNGRFARYSSKIKNGKLVGFTKEDEGKFYTQDNVIVEVVPVGSGATAVASIKSWRRNRFSKFSSILDSNNGIFYENKGRYGFAHLGNPVDLRNYLSDFGISHSPILGFAYDGNPIYGPYGYTEATNISSSVSRMTSSYALNTDRVKGPSEAQYPLGSFVDDYKYRHRSGSLDENNGRFCVTPEYPEGTYAYFITVDEANNSVFPYILGKNYYSVPVSINYTTDIDQDKLPKNVKRLNSEISCKNGENIVGHVNNVYSGGVSGIIAIDNVGIFSVGSEILSSESSVVAKVSKLKGKQVEVIENNETKAIKIKTKNFCYLYDGDIITQENTNAYGEIVGNVFDGNTFIIRNITGQFNLTDTVYSETEVVSLILDQPSTFTSQSLLRLVNGKKTIIKSITSNKLTVSVNPFAENEPISFTNSFSEIVSNKIYYVVDRKIKSFKISETPGGAPLTLTDNLTPTSIAEGEKGRSTVLETSEEKNNVKIEITDGIFEQDLNYYLISSTLTDSSTSKIVDSSLLSSNIELSNINDNIALAKTTLEHGLSEGDFIEVDIKPNDTLTQTTYYVRKRGYQRVKISSPAYSTFIDDTGIGRLQVLNNGSYFNSLGNVSGDYANGLSDTFTNIELIFLDQSKTRLDLGKPGDLNNARATINVTNGIVTSINIQDKGSSYIEGDLLTVSNQDLDRLSPSLSSNYLIVAVDHVGFDENETILRVGSTLGVSEDDFLQIGSEIVKVSSILSSKNLEVIRAQKNTAKTDHFNTTEVTLDGKYFNLQKGYQPNNSYIIEEYDEVKNEIIVSYPINTSLTTRNKLFNGSNFSDQSTPSKLISVIQIIEDIKYKFEFSVDQITWNKNPNLNIQNNYRYIFDLSSSSLRDTFFEISPSNNYNIFTVESDISNILPGYSGAYYSVKFGFGANVSQNLFDEEFDLKYNTYFYFDKSGIIDSEGSSIKVNSDPLQGKHIVSYVTPFYFSYDLSEIPDYDGYGEISYTTTSSTATGYIEDTQIFNSGQNLTKLPIIFGVTPAEENRCVIDYSIVAGKINSITILNSGKNYVNPQVYVNDTTGVGARFNIVKNSNGEIKSIVILSRGANYSENTSISIIETNVELYFYSDIIGKPKSITIKSNGYNFNSDFSQTPKYSTKTILALRDINFNNAIPGQIFEQYKNNVLIAYGFLESWIKGSNIIKLNGVVGQFENNLEIINDSGDHALVIREFTSILNPEVTSSTFTQKGYASNKSHLSENSQKLADSYFYQDYSYVIKSKTPINRWRKLVTDTVHPAGFKVFGDLVINTSASIPPPQEIGSASAVSYIQLWNENDNRISVEKITKTNTISVVTIADTQEQRGKGLIAAPYIDSGDTVSYDLELNPEFDGYFNDSGNIVGTTTFDLRLRGSNTALSVSNVNNLILSLDGILQNSGSSFSVNGSQITFTQAPLGYRNQSGDSLTESNYIPGVDVPKQNFVGRFISLKNNADNASIFKKIKDISNQFDGVTTQFDLYYEDNTPCSLEAKENLLVSIDGILQRAGETPLFPYDRSYYIVKTSFPNKIIFNEAPKSQTKFNGYSIGNYLRIKLAQEITEENNTIFSLRSEIDNRAFVVDNERNLFVFIDGVLQNRGVSYTIKSDYIKFNEPLIEGQKIYILFCYGKDSERTLTTFNYSDRNYDKFYTLRINSATLTQGLQRYGFFGSTVFSIGDDSNPITVTRAKIVGGERVSGDTWDLSLVTGGQRIDITKSLGIEGIPEFTGLPSFELVSASDFIRHNYYPRLYLFDSQNYEYLEKGDLIKIDGENDYRDVKDFIDYPVDYDNGSYFTKFRTSNNNNIIPGVNLTVEAEIENGSIASITWSGEKMPNYLAQSSSKFIGRAKLLFIPQPVLSDGGEIVSLPAGGGAEGFVYFNENTVVATIITNPGSGYLTAPRVLVGLGYDIKKSNGNRVRKQINSIVQVNSSESFASFSPAAPSEIIPRLSGYVLIPSDVIISVEGFGFGNNYVRLRWAAGYTNEEVGVTGPARNIKIRGIFNQDPQNADLNNEIIGTWNVKPDTFDINANFVDINITGYLDVGIYDVTDEINAYFYVSAVGNIVKIEAFITNDVNDVINAFATFRETFASCFGLIPQTNAISGFAPFLLVDSLFANEVKIDRYYGGSVEGTPIASLNQEDSKFIVTIFNVSVLNNTRIETGEAVNYPAGLLQIDLSESELIVYLANTDKFTESGYLLIGTEVVYYSSRLSDRFFVTERGAFNSLIAYHEAGTYVRQYEADLADVSTDTDTTLFPAQSVVTVSIEEINIQPITLSIINQGQVSENLNVSGSEIRIERDPQVINPEIVTVATVSPINKYLITESASAGVIDISQQSIGVFVGGRDEDLAIDIEPVFGGVAGAFTAQTDEVTSIAVIQSVFADVTTFQYITVTPPVDIVFATPENIEAIIVTTSIDAPLPDSGIVEYEAQINVGIATVAAISEETLTTSIIAPSVLADVTPIQEIIITPPIDTVVATVIDVITVSTNADSEGEVIFIQTNESTASEIGIGLSVDISYEFTPIIVPKIFVDTTVAAEISLQQQLILEQNSVIDITPNEVVANDVNNIQIYRTIETGLGSNGAGVDVLGEYPYQSELMNVSLDSVALSTTLFYQIDIDNTTVTPIQEITVTPPADVNEVISVGMVNVEAIIITTTIDDPLPDSGIVEYEAQINVGVTYAASTTTDSILQTFIESTSFVDVIPFSEVIGFYNTLRTSQTTLPVDPEPLLSPVAIIVDDIITNIDKPITAAYVPIEPQASVTLAALDTVITNRVNLETFYTDFNIFETNIVSIKISPQVNSGVDSGSAISTFITTIIDKATETAPLLITTQSQITVTRSTGIIDYYQESLYINDDIVTRNDGIINIDSYSIATRDSSTITAKNIEERMQFNPYETYGVGNVGISIDNIEYNAFFNNNGADGTSVNTTFNEVEAGRMQLDEFTNTYPSITIEDFELRNNSRFSIAGDNVNTGISTYTTVDLGADNIIEDSKVIEDPTP